MPPTSSDLQQACLKLIGLPAECQGFGVCPIFLSRFFSNFPPDQEGSFYGMPGTSYEGLEGAECVIWTQCNNFELEKGHQWRGASDACSTALREACKRTTDLRLPQLSMRSISSGSHHHVMFLLREVKSSSYISSAFKAKTFCSLRRI